MIRELVLPQEAWDRVIEHARAVFPDEAVGMLGGTGDGRVVRVAPLPNLAAGGAFLADPRAQYDAERTFSQLKLIPLAVYHSHPWGTATLSRVDRAFARPSLVQLVIALPHKGRVDMRAYRIGAAVLEIPVRVED